MSPEKHRRTFISYSRINKEFALKLALELRSAGIDVWLDQLDIPIGEQWDDAIEKALEECEIFMVILTPASSMSDNVKDEIGYAIDTGKRILPILLENAKVPLRLRRLQYVDFTTKSYEEGVESAKQLIRRLIEEPTIPRDQLSGQAETPVAEDGDPALKTKETIPPITRRAQFEPERVPFKAQAEKPAYKQPEILKGEIVPVPQKLAPAKKSLSPLIFGAAGAGVLVIAALAVFALRGGSGGKVPTTGGPEQAAMVENTQASVLVEAKPTDTAAPEPTQAAAQPTDTLEPTAVPTAAGDQKYFTEEFEGDLSAWQPFFVDRKRDENQPVIVADPTNEQYKDVSASGQDGFYLFNIPRRQTTIYSFFDSFHYDDVRVDVRVDSHNINPHKLTLICRYSKENGWYEFRIAHNGPYGIYYAKPNATGLITYRTIADGATDKVKPGNAVNEYGIVCQGSELSLYINGELIKQDKDLLGVLRTGKVGVAVTSLDGLPVEVGIDWVKFSQPE